MALDGIAVKCVAEELNRAFSGTRVDKIFQPERDEIVITAHGPAGGGRLVISASASNARAHLSEAKKENPAQAPLFCMLLRKHLIPSRILRVEQVGFERVLRIDFSATTELGDTVVKSLYAELMGRHSNIILVDGENRILDSVKHIDMSVSSVRQVMPGLPYEGAPPQDKKNPLDETEAGLLTTLGGHGRNETADTSGGTNGTVPDAGAVGGLCSNPIDVSTGAANDLSGLAADMAAQEGSLAGKMSEGKGSKNFNGASVADGGFDAVIRDKALGTDAGGTGGARLDKLLLNAYSGLSPMACREIVYRATGDCDTRVGTLNEQEIQAVARTALRFFADIRESRFCPTLIGGTDKWADFAPFYPEQYGDNTKIVKMASMSEAMERFYADRDAGERHRQRTAALSKLVGNLIERSAKKVTIFQKTLRDAAGKERLRRCGDLIMANIYRIQPGDKALEAEDFYSENGETVSIALDPQKSAAQNAQKYYTRYNKQKTAEKMAAEQLRQTEEELVYLESVQQFLEEAQSPDELAELREELYAQGYLSHRPKRQKEKRGKINPLSFTSSDGFTIFVGKNNIQNDYITFKLSRSNDIWLHTKNIPGSHTLIRRGNADEIPERTLLEAAALCVLHSKAKNGVKVPVDYTEIKNVKKIAGAKPGMVIYENFSTLFVTPAEVELPQV